MLNVKWYSFHRENIRRVYENQPAKKEIWRDISHPAELYQSDFSSVIFDNRRESVKNSPISSQSQTALRVSKSLMLI